MVDIVGYSFAFLAVCFGIFALVLARSIYKDGL